MSSSDLGLPTYLCHRVDENIPIDGDLAKPVWRFAQVHWLAPAVGVDHYPSAIHYQPTAFRACYSPTCLYLSFDCVDADIWSTYTQRDDPLYDEEVVEAFISPTGDLRRYYELEVNPRNALFDASVYSPDLARNTMTVDTGWSCEGIQTAVCLDGTLDNREDSDRGWSVEIAIPFAAFPQAEPPVAGTVWRANFYRIDRAGDGEFTAWSPTLEFPPNFHVPARFGFLRFE